MTDEIANPTHRVQQWLDGFEETLNSSDPAQAANLFEEGGFWRDLVAMTWNIKTMEGRDAIAHMLEHTARRSRPTNWKVTEEATEQDGVIEAWVTFETEEALGKGQLRLRDGAAWTLLTTMQELKEFPEKRKFLRPKGAQHGASKSRQTWLEARQEEERELGYSRQPYCVIIGGGQGGIGLAARPRLVRPHALPALPGPLAGLRSQRQDWRLAGDVHQGDGAQLLELYRVHRGEI